MARAKVACISHGEDVDGLVCAAYLLRLEGAAPVLVSYDEIKGSLERIEPPLDGLYICDLGLREDLRGEVERIGRFASVTVVDHHPTASDVLERLERSGVAVVYNPLDCAAALLYDRLAGRLGREAGRLAAYAAVADQFEEGPIASRLLPLFDRHFVQHEALILAHALARDPPADVKLRAVEGLSGLTPPHRLEGVAEAALAHLEHMAGLMERLPSEASRLGRLAYAEASAGSSLGDVANLLLDTLVADVGVSYRGAEGGTLNISLRCRRGLGVHIGVLTRRLAERLGGFGGGHERASGASIPRGSLQGFIAELNAELDGAEPGSRGSPNEKAP